MISLMPVTLDGDELAEIHAVFASNPDYWRYSGDLDPDAVTVEAVEGFVRGELGQDGYEVLAARDEAGALVGYVELLLRHPRDKAPWIGFLVVHGDRRGQGLGRAVAAAAEARLRGRGDSVVWLGVLENNVEAFKFWTALGYAEVDRRPDVAKGRPTIVMRKSLA
ncbi:GNAT family N-acetyltransferase [Actinomadura gamaensis]|uniref:GNAT family N-acetyltransferase n=1 Tax=Actinomadura gamaensis TaxID=1763541 RepID=A0ABV9TP97_9ACTN